MVAQGAWIVPMGHLLAFLFRSVLVELSRLDLEVVAMATEVEVIGFVLRSAMEFKLARLVVVLSSAICSTTLM